MMHAHPRKTSAASIRPARRRFQGIWILAAVSFIALVAGCSPADDALAPTNGLRVLGLYEFTFENVGTDAMTASVARVDDGVGSLALGTDPVTGLSLAFVSSGAVLAPGGTGPTRVEPGGGRRYIWAEYAVTNTNAAVDLTGITFLGYSSVGNSVDGSAFAEALDLANGAVSPSTIRPSGEVRLDGDDPQRVRMDLLDGSYGMSVVAYDEDNDVAFQGMKAAVSGRSFVNTVFPYGFVATLGDSRASRTIPALQTGSLIVGFNAPDLNTVRWRAVAVLDDRVRIASPTEYNYRGNELSQDGFQQFLDLATAIEASNVNQQAEVVVLGAMPVGDDRLLPAVTTCATFDFVEIADVRVAGGFVGGPAAQYLIGGLAPSTAMTKVNDGANCVP